MESAIDRLRLHLRQKQGMEERRIVDNLKQDIVSPIPLKKVYKLEEGETFGNMLFNGEDVDGYRQFPGDILNETIRDRSINDQTPALNHSSNTSSENSEILHETFDLMTEKYRVLVSQNEHIKTTLDEYEKTIDEMIRDKTRLQKVMETMKEDKECFEAEAKAIDMAYRELKIKYDDMRIISEGFRKNEQVLEAKIETRENDILSLEKKYEALKIHMQNRLGLMEQEMIKLKQANEEEISVLKKKADQDDQTIRTLKEVVETRNRENKELVSICDELIQKMDSMGSYQ